MMYQTNNGEFKKVGFYELSERKPKAWQRYADVLVPFLTLPLIFVVGLYLHLYMTDPKAATGEFRSEIFALSAALLIISLLVFVYVCIRLSTVLGGRTRIRLPMVRSNRSQACLMKSINTNLAFMAPLNNHPITYESIIFNLPPYPKPTERNHPSSSLARINSEEEGLTI